MLMQETLMPRSATFSLADKIYLWTEGWKLDGVTNIIDISWWQDPALIDYDELASQVDGAILRAAYSKWVDRRFETHYRELTDRNVPVGCYHYITGDESPQAQVDALYSAVGGYDLPVGMNCDVEDTRSGTALYRNLVDAYLDIADGKFNTLQDVYTSMYCWRQIMQDATHHGHRKLWVAHYTSAPKPLLPAGWVDYDKWQFTSSAKFEEAYYSGIDNSRYNGTEEEWYALFGFTPPSNEPNEAELKQALSKALDIIEAKANSDSAWSANALIEVEEMRKCL